MSSASSSSGPSNGASSSGGPGMPRSVRDLYTPQQQDWLFIPPNSNNSPGAANAASHSSGSATIGSIELDSSRPVDTHNTSRLNLELGEDDLEDVVGVGNITPYSVFTLFASEYLTTALGMPFEVGKTLLQVEWKPKEGVAEMEDEDDLGDEGEQRGGVEQEEEDAPGGSRPRTNAEDIRNPEEAEAYFSDIVSGAASGRQFAPQLEPLPEAESSVLEQTDEDGYLAEGSSGVWGMMRRVRHTPSEGLPGLWKGQILSTFHSLLTNNLQPVVHGALVLALPASEINADLDLPLASHPKPAFPLGLHVVSHLVTHLFLSPIEVLRTRVIVQPMPIGHSSIALCRDLVNKEGWKSLFFSPRILLPAVLEHTLRPLLTLSIPLFIERQLLVTPDASPLTYSMLDLGLGLASLLVILPIETVRKRLQLQNADGERAQSIVRLRDRPYVGIVETIYRIVTEESGVPRRRKRSERRRNSNEPPERKSKTLDGIKQLYRGFGMAAGAHLTVCALGLVSAGLGGSGPEMGWKEL